MRELAQSHLTCAVTARIIHKSFGLKFPIYWYMLVTFYFPGSRCALFYIEGSKAEAHREEEFTL